MNFLRTCGFACGIGVVLWLGAAPAMAQRQTNSTSNRPSEFSPSSALGSVGGSNTRDVPLGQQGRRSDSESTIGASASVRSRSGLDRPSRFDYDKFGGSQLQLSPARNNLNTALMRPTSPTQMMPFSRNLRPRRGPLGLTPTASGDLAQVAGVNSITTLDAPLGGWQGVNELPRLKTSFLTQDAEDSFCAYFGLKEAPSAGSGAGASESAPKMSEAMAEVNRQDVAQMATRTLQMFKEATLSSGDDQRDKLTRTAQLLDSMRRLDRAAHLPILLQVHCALEKQQLTVALKSLYETVRRHPGVFTDKPDMGTYFGDPQLLTRQMRRFVNTDQANPNDPDAYVMSAYCAWVLWVRNEGELGRIRQALQGAEKTLQEREKLGLADAKERLEVLTFKQALEAALP